MWAKKGNIGDVKLYYSKDGGAYQYINTKPSADLNCSWQVPNEISNNVKIKIEAASDETVYKESDQFHIKGLVNLTDPDGGEIYDIGGAPATITWTYRGT
jgi:hypothetical protein